MKELLEFSLGSIWSFFGCMSFFYVFIYFTVNFILRIWSRFMRMIMVFKHGWPPSHLDADGDWGDVEEEIKE